MPNSFSIALEKAIDRHPPTTTQEALIQQALRQMQAITSSYLLIVNSGDRLISLVTERDLLDVIANRRYSSATTLAEVMPATIITAKAAQIPNLLAARFLLRQHQIRHLPLVTDTGKVEGVITYDNLNRLLNPIDLLRLRYAADVMASAVVWAPPQTPLNELTDLMVKHRVSCIVIGEALPVLGHVHPVGIITETDIIRLWLQDENFANVRAQALLHDSFEHIMTTDSLWHAQQVMQTHRTRRLVVVDHQGFLAGVVTQSSLFQSVEPAEALSTLDTLTYIIDEHTADLSQANAELQRILQERKRAKAALQQQIFRERLVRRVMQDIRQSLEIGTILTTAVDEVRNCFQADRTLIHRITNQNAKTGKIIAEAVADSQAQFHQSKTLGTILNQLDFHFYASGRVHSIPDLQATDCSSQKAHFLGYLGIRSILIAPILVKDQLWGLLIATQQTPRRWERPEVALFEQITAQLGLAIQQAILYAQLGQANQKLLDKSNTDALTQLSNRRHFNDYLAQEWHRLKREQQPLSLILCDVDHFKLYNDTYGHQAGDDCLKKIAQVIKQVIKRPADHAARYGGEEFVMVLPNTPLASAQHLAEQIRQSVQAQKIPHQSSQTSNWVTLSLGVASGIPSAQSSPEVLLKLADEALYSAKENGRNQWAAHPNALLSEQSVEMMRHADDVQGN